MSAADRERHVDQARARALAKHAETTPAEIETRARLDALAAEEGGDRAGRYVDVILTADERHLLLGLCAHSGTTSEVRPKEWSYPRLLGVLASLTSLQMISEDDLDHEDDGVRWYPTRLGVERARQELVAERARIGRSIAELDGAYPDWPVPKPSRGPSNTRWTLAPAPETDPRTIRVGDPL